MADDALRKWVVDEEKKGYTPAQLKTSLQQRGFSQEQIRHALENKPVSHIFPKHILLIAAVAIAIVIISSGEYLANLAVYAILIGVYFASQFLHKIHHPTTTVLLHLTEVVIIFFISTQAAAIVAGLMISSTIMYFMMHRKMAFYSVFASKIISMVFALAGGMILAFLLVPISIALFSPISMAVLVILTLVEIVFIMMLFTLSTSYTTKQYHKKPEAWLKHAIIKGVIASFLVCIICIIIISTLGVNFGMQTFQRYTMLPEFEPEKYLIPEEKVNGVQVAEEINQNIKLATDDINSLRPKTGLDPIQYIIRFYTDETTNEIADFTIQLKHATKKLAMYKNAGVKYQVGLLYMENKSEADVQNMRMKIDRLRLDLPQPREPMSTIPQTGLTQLFEEYEGLAGSIITKLIKNTQVYSTVIELARDIVELEKERSYELIDEIYTSGAGETQESMKLRTYIVQMLYADQLIEYCDDGNPGTEKTSCYQRVYAFAGATLCKNPEQCSRIAKQLEKEELCDEAGREMRWKSNLIQECHQEYNK